MDLSEQLQRLPEDVIIHNIFPLMDSTSRARAATVSPLWRSFSRRAPAPATDAHRSIPWILITDEKLHHHLVEPSTSFSLAVPHRRSSYRLKVKKNYKVKPDRENSKFIVATHRQYMMHNQLHSYRGVIHDLFSGEKIKLSPAACCWPMAHFSYLKNLPKPNLAAVMEDCDGHTLIYRSWIDHDGKWKLAFNEGDMPDLIFHKNQLFCVSNYRGIKAMHITTPNLPTEWPKYSNTRDRPVLDHVRTIVPEKERNYPRDKVEYHLVESCDGMKLWLVTQYELPDGETKFEVHLVVEGHELVEVTDLGETMLFVKAGSSVSCWSTLRTLSTPASPDEFFTKNSIYFFHKGISGDKTYNLRLGKFTLGDDLAVFHPCPIYSVCYPHWIHPVVNI